MHVNNARDTSVTQRAVYTVDELRVLTGVNRNRIYKMAADGEIPCIRAGKRLIFPKAAIDRWMAEAGNRTAA